MTRWNERDPRRLNKAVMACVTEEEYDRIHRTANIAGISVSHWSRNALVAAIPAKAPKSRTVSLAYLDRLIRLHQRSAKDLDGPETEEFHELLWQDDVMAEILQLARRALLAQVGVT